MPRTARKISCSGFYHVMIRGVNKEIIFKDDRDRMNFLHLLKYYKTKLNCIIHAYCLMDNHVHILIEDNDCKLGELMRNITCVYAGEFNKKYKRVGHLFQERFKSQNIEDEFYLLRLIRYIHRNPEKAGICNTEDYKWSSYKEYINGEKIIKRNFILEKYSKNTYKAIEEFKRQMKRENNDLLDAAYIKHEITDEMLMELIKYELKIENIDEIRKMDKSRLKESIQKIKRIRNIKDIQLLRVLNVSKNILYRN